LSPSLTTSFIATAREIWELVPGDHGALESALASALEAAIAQWPGLTLPADCFARYLAERTPDETDPVEALASMHTTDLYLACGCTFGIPRAIELFESDIVPAIAPAIARIDSDADFGSEIVHEMRVKLLVAPAGTTPKIASYVGRGPLRSWVQVAAIRAATSAKRRQPAERPHDLTALASAPWIGADAELAHIRREGVDAFRDAFAQALRHLDVRERNILRFYVVDGLSSEAIGRMYHVHRATVARWIAQAQESLLRDTRRHLRAALALSPEEVESLMRVVRSQLDISIVSMLRRAE
jgi:RNA polymerase sigma-70 factor (ECF subfamily)